MKIAFILATVLAAALTLSGCSADVPAPQQPEETQEQPAAQSEEKSTTLEFGQSYTYDVGVTMTVSAPEEFKPGAHAYGNDEAHNLKFTFTIENGSSEELEPVVFTHVKSAGVKTTQVYDVDNGIDADPRENIAPGGSVTWIEAYSVADPTAPLILTTSPNMHEYIELTFTNAK